MSEQLTLFDGFVSRVRHWVPVEITDRPNYAPYVDVDFGELPSISDMQAAYKEGRPIPLVTMEGNTGKFHVITDLGYEGWPDDPTIDAPPYVFYEGTFYEGETLPVHLRDPLVAECWLLLIEPGGNIDGTNTHHFGWRGEPFPSG